MALKKAEWKVGEKVEVPVYEFQPCRTGWNGWNFACGEIVATAIGNGAKNKGKQYAIVKYKYRGKEEQHQFSMDRVFKQTETTRLEEEAYEKWSAKQK